MANDKKSPIKDSRALGAASLVLAVVLFLAINVFSEAAIKGVQQIGIEGGRQPAMRIWLESRYFGPPTGHHRTMLFTRSGCITPKAATGEHPMHPPIRCAFSIFR